MRLKTTHLIPILLVLGSILINCTKNFFFKVPLFGTLERLSWKFLEEVNFRKVSTNQYKIQINDRINQTIRSIKHRQEVMSEDAEKELENYLASFNRLYNESLESMGKQREVIADLNDRIQLYTKTRPKKIDESLDDFRQLFNESQLPDLTNFWEFKDKEFTVRRKLAPYPTIPDSKDKGLDSLTQILDNMNKKLRQNATSSNQFEVKLKEIDKIKDEFWKGARNIEKASQQALEKSLNKQDLRIEKSLIEDRLKKFDKDTSDWIENQLTAAEEAFKNFKEQVSLSESMYLNLVGKKRAKLEYTAVTDKTLSLVLKLIDETPADGWKLALTENDKNVYSKRIDGKYNCVKITATVDAAPRLIAALFEDNTRSSEYNSFFARGSDVEAIDESTKIVWTFSTPIWIMKPRDFCTLVHMRQLKDGTYLFLQKAVDHPLCASRSPFVRGRIVIAANIISPVKGKPNQALCTMLSQVDPGGFAPAVIVNRLCTNGPIGFMQALQDTANREPSKLVLLEKKRLHHDPTTKPLKY